MKNERRSFAVGTNNKREFIKPIEDVIIKDMTRQQYVAVTYFGNDVDGRITFPADSRHNNNKKE